MKCREPLTGRDLGVRAGAGRFLGGSSLVPLECICRASLSTGRRENYRPVLSETETGASRFHL